MFLLTLAACSKDGSIFGDEADSGDSGTPWWENDYDYEGDDPPEAKEGKSWCEPATGSAGDLFFFQIEGFDKQGEDSLTGGTVIAEREGTLLFEHPLFYCDDAGDCEGSWTAASWSGELSCNENAVEQYSFEGFLVDKQGNESDTITLAWDGIKESNGGGD